MQEHAAGAFDVAEKPPGFFAGCHLGTTWEARYGAEMAAVPFGHTPALRTVFFWGHDTLISKPVYRLQLHPTFEPN